MIIVFNNICDKCSIQLYIRKQLKYCGYCGIQLIQKEIDVPYKIWEVIMRYCEIKDIISLIHVNKEFYFEGHKNGSYPLSIIYGINGLDEEIPRTLTEFTRIELLIFYSIYKKILTRNDDFSNKYTIYRKQTMSYCKDTNIDYVMKLENDGIIVPKMYSNKDVYFRIKKENIDKLFIHFIKVSLLHSHKYVNVRSSLDRCYIYCREQLKHRCIKCDKIYEFRKPNINYINNLEKNGHCSIECIIENATNCYMCNVDINKYLINDYYRQRFGEKYFCEYIPNVGFNYKSIIDSCILKYINKYELQIE